MTQRNTFTAFVAAVFLINNVLHSDGLKINGNEEGPCNLPEAQEDIDFDWIKSVPLFYISAGNTYQLYRCAAGHPFFSYARETEFYYGFCPSAVLNFETGIMDAYGFGGAPIGTYTFTLPKFGVYDLIPQSPVPGAGQHLLGVITLTDNENYIFIYKCWSNINQRGWELFTTKPAVSPYLQKEIEEHAVSLGFDRSQFQFLRYEFCADQRYHPRCQYDYPTYEYGKGYY